MANAANRHIFQEISTGKLSKVVEAISRSGLLPTVGKMTKEKK